MDEKTIFQKAFALVSNPETWCKNVYRRRKDGEITGYCSLGALMAYGGGNYSSDFIDHPEAPRSKIVQAFNPSRCMGEAVTKLADFNDTHTHEEVVALWKKVGEENNWLDQDGRLDGIADAVTSR